jgi:hypothetical protein
MKPWARRMRGAIGLGVFWAVGWVAFGLALGVSSLLLPGLPWGRLFEVFDAPLPALAMPAFIGGVLFSFVLGIAGRRRRFEELSVPRFAAWGAAAGLMLSLIPASLVGLGLATPRPDLGIWRITATIAGPLMLLSAASAAGSLILARRAQRREWPGEPGITGGEPDSLGAGIPTTERTPDVPRSRSRTS